MSGATVALGSADLLRQLVYLPQASIFVAEARARPSSGVQVLALRPSVVAGGYVGSVDLLVVDPEHDADRVTRRPPRGGHPVGTGTRAAASLEAVQPDGPNGARTRLGTNTGLLRAVRRQELHVAAGRARSGADERARTAAGIDAGACETT